MKEKKLLRVRMLGSFEMEMDGVKLTDESIRSNMSLKLLVYMLCKRSTILHVSEICEVLWEDDSSDNPVGALKNLVYRLRTSLKSAFGETDFIRTLRGSYAWEDAYEVELDIEQFELYCSKAAQQSDKKEKLACYEAALSLYRADFLPKFSYERWILQLATYYHSLFLTSVKELGSLYVEEKEFGKLEALCNHALRLEELDEAIHRLLIIALIGQGENKLAEEHYNYTSQLMYSQLGIHLSEETKKLHRQIMDEVKEKEMDLTRIQQELTEDEKKGAYLCEFGVFRRIYKLEARQAKRLGIAAYCALITIESNLSFPLEGDAYRKFIAKAMENLGEVLKNSLRSGDIVSQYSATQYMLLLVSCSYEGGLIALHRVKSNYFKLDSRKKTRLICDLREIEDEGML